MFGARLTLEVQLPCGCVVRHANEMEPPDAETLCYACWDPACMCLWRDCGGGNMGLLNGKQKSCAVCEIQPLYALRQLIAAPGLISSPALHLAKALDVWLKIEAKRHQCTKEANHAR